MVRAVKSHWRILLVLSVAVIGRGSAENETDSFPQNCKAWTMNGDGECSWEPDLRPMTVDYGGGYTESFYAYVTPDVSVFYNKTEGSLKPQKPRTKAQYGKFVNMSPDMVQVYWEPVSRNSPPSYIADIKPFECSGTATYRDHVFIVTPRGKPDTVLERFVMNDSTQVYYYDPFKFNLEKAKKKLSQDQLVLYHAQLVNKLFAEQYKAFTGRDWLALYKHKQPPQYHMWRADSIGQTYTIETKEIHFVELPDPEELKRGTSIYGPRPDEKNRMRRHMARDPTMNLTLSVLSCSPRVFEIKNFLSDTEVEHILNVAGNSDLKRSSTRASEGSDARNTDVTRTSRNSWIGRSKDLVIDTIYRRSADLMQMNEALFRARHRNDIPELEDSMVSIAERLQLVHYDVGQKYEPHYDFMMPAMVRLQPSRFATILFYLNDDMEGGETSFPLWLNAETRDELRVKPEKGKAVLFYSLLPDGNYDDRSLHSARPVTKNEKWLTNLWM